MGLFSSELKPHIVLLITGPVAHSGGYVGLRVRHVVFWASWPYIFSSSATHTRKGDRAGGHHYIICLIPSLIPISSAAAADAAASSPHGWDRESYIVAAFSSEFIWLFCMSIFISSLYLRGLWCEQFLRTIWYFWWFTFANVSLRPLDLILFSYLVLVFSHCSSNRRPHEARQQIRVSDALIPIVTSVLYVAESEPGDSYHAWAIFVHMVCASLSPTPCSKARSSCDNLDWYGARQQIRVSDALNPVATSVLYVAEGEVRNKFHVCAVSRAACASLCPTRLSAVSFTSFTLIKLI